MVVDNSQKNDLIASCDIEAELDERQLCDVELLMQGGGLIIIIMHTCFDTLIHSMHGMFPNGNRLFSLGWLHGRS